MTGASDDPDPVVAQAPAGTVVVIAAGSLPATVLLRGTLEATSVPDLEAAFATVAATGRLLVDVCAVDRFDPATWSALVRGAVGRGSPASSSRSPACAGPRSSTCWPRPPCSRSPRRWPRYGPCAPVTDIPPLPAPTVRSSHRQRRPGPITWSAIRSDPTRPRHPVGEAAGEQHARLDSARPATAHARPRPRGRRRNQTPAGPAVPRTELGRGRTRRRRRPHPTFSKADTDDT